MADNTTFEKYQESGHSQASGVSDLQQQVSKVPVSDDALRKQAEAQYADTLKTLDDSYSKQISALITSQANDEKLLNEQYNNSISSMMAQLKKRGLDVTEALPQAQTAAINRHRNDTMAVRQSLYSAQSSLPEQQKQLLSADYEKAIAQRVSANRSTNIPVLSNLLGQIAELQNASYTDYINYLLAKKSRGGSSRKKRASGGNPGGTQGGYVPPSVLSGNQGSVTATGTYVSPFGKERY